jgi:hypothetical protein
MDQQIGVLPSRPSERERAAAEMWRARLSSSAVFAVMRSPIAGSEYHWAVPERGILGCATYDGPGRWSIRNGADLPSEAEPVPDDAVLLRVVTR